MTTEPLLLTDRASRRICEILAKEPGKTALRLAVNGGGCSGFQYEFALAGAKAADDIAIEKNGAVLLVDEISLDYLRGSEVDFVDDLMGSSFRVNNPNAKMSAPRRNVILVISPAVTFLRTSLSTTSANETPARKRNRGAGRVPKSCEYIRNVLLRASPPSHES